MKIHLDYFLVPFDFTSSHYFIISLLILVEIFGFSKTWLSQTSPGTFY